jgi:hypothetical protein
MRLTVIRLFGKGSRTDSWYARRIPEAAAAVVRYSPKKESNPLEKRRVLPPVSRASTT